MENVIRCFPNLPTHLCEKMNLLRIKVDLKASQNQKADLKQREFGVKKFGRIRN